jgi:Ca2+-binding EF-hand superfamily protein
LVRKILLYWTLKYAYKIDINEFIRGFILTTKGDLQSKIEYTFRIYDQNGDKQISGEEIKKMANVI